MRSNRGNYRHGHKPQNGGSPEYYTWNAMWSRCTNPSQESYPLYGGRGITVCDRWRKFDKFLEDIGLRPSNSHSLDRIDPDGDYCPGNVKWSTAAEQASNRRYCIRLTCNGQTLTIAAWAKRLGCSWGILKLRYKAGWDQERIIRTPVDSRRGKRQAGRGAALSKEKQS